MKTKAIITFMTVALLMAYATTSTAQKADKSLDGWMLMGTRIVDYTLDRDVILFNDSTQTFTSLKFIVKNGTLNMHKATVHFANSEYQNIDFSEEVNKKNDGRKIDLIGNKRFINKVTFWYDTKNNSANKSVVELWGKM